MAGHLRRSVSTSQNHLAMILDQHFQRIVIISLPGAEERAERALRELREKGLSETAVVAKAVNGRVMKPSAWWTSGDGAWGCMQSHYRVVQEAMMDGIESILVIEDDCVWANGAAELAAQFMEQVPDDWGQIYFGGQHRVKHGRPMPVPGKPAVLTGRSVHRTHVYALHQRAMVRFLQHIIYAPDYQDALHKHGYKAHFDHQLEKAHRDGHWKVYTPSWWLAGQGENLSSINGRQQRENWWQLVPDGSQRQVPLVVCDAAPTAEQHAALHFGKHLRESDPTWDDGVQASLSADELLRVMEVVSREAIEHGRLPGIAANPEKPELVEWLRARWRGPVIDLSSSPNLDGLRDFPAAKSFRHDWWNPATPHLAAVDVASESTTESPGVNGVPTVHQIWIGDAEMPPRLAAYCETIRGSFPGWNYRLWTEADLETLAEHAVIPGPVTDPTFPLGMRSDIIRLEILRQHGGVYFDTDFEALRADLRPVFDGLSRFCYGDEKSGRPSNAMMAAPKGHPFVEFFLRRIAASIHVPADLWETVNLTGPGKLAEALNLWVVNWKDDEAFTVDGNRIGALYASGTIQALWQEGFYPYHYSEGTWASFDPEKYPSAWAAHHWEGGWHREQ